MFIILLSGFFDAFLASVLYIIPNQPASKKYKKISIENTFPFV